MYVSETRQFSTEIVGKDGKTIIGLAAPYNVRTIVGGLFAETLLPGVFKKSVTERAKNLPLMLNHQHKEMPVGKAVAWEEQERGLLGAWEMDSRAEAREAYRLVEEGLLTGLSVGFDPILNRVAQEEDGLIHVSRVEARLLETSLTPIAQYEEARVLVTRTAGPPEYAPPAPRPNLERWSKWYDQIKAGAQA